MKNIIRSKSLQVVGSVIILCIPLACMSRISPFEGKMCGVDDLVYSSYFGGNALDIGTAITQDSKGNIIIAGITYSSDFPTTAEAFDTTYNGGADVFVSKLSPDGISVIFSTYIGGSEDELHFNSINYWESKIAIAIDSQDNIIIHGPTHSTDFPVTPSAYDETYNGALVDGEHHTGDMFVLKLAENGSDILFSTFFGGSDAEENAQNIVIDEFDNIYLSGWTRSIDFPITPDALNTTHNGKWDAFISKLAANGSSLLYSTYFGGSEIERGMVIERDLNNNIYIGGETFSLDLPITPDAFDPVGKSADGFFAKVSPNGSELLYSTYVSGSNNEKIDDIAIDEVNNDLYIIGTTWSSDLKVTSNSYDWTFNGEEDGFVMKIATSGELGYSTYIGGLGLDGFEKILLDGNNDIYLMGYSSSTDYPTTSNAYAPTNRGGSDLIITKMLSNGSGLLYSSYFGGNGYEPTLWQNRKWENIPDISLVSKNSVLIVSTTDSSDYPVTNNALNKTLNGQSDVCISQLVFTDLPTFPNSSTTTTITTDRTSTTDLSATTATTITTTPVEMNFPNFLYLLIVAGVIITLRKKQKR